MMPTNVLAWFLLVPLCGIDCRQPGEPYNDATRPIVFFSFESDADTSGWTGYGGYRFAVDAPPGGGCRSFEVSGGCIVPHAVRSLDVPHNGSTLTLSFWGKNLALGGCVSVRRSDASADDLFISVTDTAWKEYRASAPTACRAGNTLRLELISGGIVYSAMRVDLLEVRLDDDG